MFLRPFFTVLLVLLFCLHATCATIKIRSVPISNTKEVLEHTTEPISPSIHDAPPVAAVLRRSKRHETTIDWREDQALRLESEREAGFRLGSYDDNNNDDDDNDQYPSPAFWPLFKICIVSAIAISILKVIRDLRG